jgi:transposase
MPVYSAAADKPSCASPGCWCRDRRPCYPSDLTDEHWKVLEPQAREVMAELTVAVGRPMVHDLRAMCDAVAHVVRNGIEWRALPVDLPPWEAVYAFYERWNGRGLPLALMDLIAGVGNQAHDLGFSCGAEGTRTPDPLDANEVRYQLRYSPWNVDKANRHA